MTPTLDLAMALMRRPSVTPEDCDCQDLMASRLAAVGFNNEWMPFAEVKNLWSRRGQQSPLVVFAGHTDVVPTGPESAWQVPPFEPAIVDGRLIGRGAADMKGSLAAMVVACENFVRKHPNHKGSIGFLITADEEGPAVNGTVKVVETLEARNEKIDYCLVGEPSSTNKVGDVIKYGRRGSMLAYLKVKGKQGHVAYPHLAANPIHLLAPALAELVAIEWDQGNDAFPPTSMQIANYQSGTGATNVIPGVADLQLSFRFCTESSPESLQQRLEAVLAKHQLDVELHYNITGLPFLTDKGPLIEAVTQAVERVTGERPELSTAGGTSDGRFIAPTGAQVVELGPVNATIHQVNEHVLAADLDLLAQMYYQLLVGLLLEK